MLYSHACGYALRALIVLATEGEGRWVGAKEIARREGIPAPFITKILHDLTRRKLVRSVKGPGGGFQLTKAPHQIAIYEVVDAVDGLEELEICAHDGIHCPPHGVL